jgi:catechol 2,3-dioxygenase-like lactoylglutathione lyase family enzyme
VSVDFTIDHLVIAVDDLDAATTRYQSLLGCSPSWRGEHPSYGTRNTLFRFANSYLELLAADTDASSPLAEALRDALGSRRERAFLTAIGVTDAPSAVAHLRAAGVKLPDPLAGNGIDLHSGRQRQWCNTWLDRGTSRGLHVLIIQHLSPPDALPFAEPTAAAHSVVRSIDHAVYFTPNAAAAAQWWSALFGATESVRQTFPERRTINILLELGGVIIECIEPTAPPKPLAHDRFWGLAYRVDDLDLAVDRVRRAGFEIDAPRNGLAPRTRVATVRWDNVPTLFIERP